MDRLGTGLVSSSWRWWDGRSIGSQEAKGARVAKLLCSRTRTQERERCGGCSSPLLAQRARGVHRMRTLRAVLAWVKGASRVIDCVAIGGLAGGIVTQGGG